MSSSGNRARSVDAQSDGVSSHQPSTIQKETVRSGVDTPASLSSSSDSHGSVSEGLRARSHLYDENHAESVRNIDTSPHASLVTAADLATCLAENTVRSAPVIGTWRKHKTSSITMTCGFFAAGVSISGWRRLDNRDAGSRAGASARASSDPAPSAPYKTDSCAPWAMAGAATNPIGIECT